MTIGNSPTIFILVGIMNFSLVSQPTENGSSLKRYIEENIPSKEEIDVFIHEDSWMQFDPEVGYILGNYLPHDGLDRSTTISTVQDNGARTSFIYQGKPCRINTYGNSFTGGNQVNDGETWQEYLAAHLGEPIRNFGVGGFGVYQSYRRMIREESKDHGAKYNILYIWGDDHFRSLLRTRYMLTTHWNNSQDLKEGVGRMFHGNFWSNVEMDMDRGVLVEKQNLLPTTESLYKMCDAEWMYKNIKDDWALQMRLYLDRKIDTINVQVMQRLSELLGHQLTTINEQHFRSSLDKLLDKYSYAATKYILQKARDFTVRHGKKLMVIIFDPYGATRQLLNEEERGDQEIVDFLNENDFDYFDMNEVHVEDFNNFALTIDQYYDRYFIGHYNPLGNHFFAFSIKTKVVNWLTPKPIPYLNDTSQSVDFGGYLKNYKGNN